jgi:hypothetical protein
LSRNGRRASRRKRQRNGSSRSGRRRRRDLIVDDIELVGRLDSHAVEALQLEIRRLARGLGLDIKEIRIKRVEEKRSG